MSKNIIKYFTGNKQKNIPIIILGVSFSFLLLAVWLVVTFIQNSEIHRFALKWIMVIWLFFSGCSWIIMAIRQEFVQIITIRGPFAVFLGVILGVGFWLVAIFFVTFR